MSTTQRMGRGLDALWGGAAPLNESIDAKPNTLNINSIFPNPNQPRKHFSTEGLEELAASITQQGIIQPLLVRPSGDKYEIVAGERRYRAAKLAGITEVPVYIRELDDAAVMAAAIIENIQRENLTPIEEAQALFSLREECGITQEELAVKLGKSRSAIANSLRLLQLTIEAQENLQNGQISAGHARAILSLADNAHAQNSLRLYIITHELSVRDAEAAVQSFKDKDKFPWDDESANMNQEQEVFEPASEVISKQGSRSKPVYLQEIQNKIKSHLDLKTSVSGTEQRGRVTLTYTNAEELEKILQSIGIDRL